MQLAWTSVAGASNMSRREEEEQSHLATIDGKSSDMQQEYELDVI